MDEYLVVYLKKNFHLRAVHLEDFSGMSSMSSNKDGH